MWILTAKSEFVNLENCDQIFVKGSAVVARAGAQEINLYIAANADAASRAMEIVCDAITRGFKRVSVESELARIEEERKRSKEAVEAAAKREAEAKARSEAKIKNLENKG